jgi:glycerol-3-phosphate dehydrogenase
MEIISRELGISQLEITKNGGHSNMVIGYSKKSMEEA